MRGREGVFWTGTGSRRGAGARVSRRPWGRATGAALALLLVVGLLAALGAAGGCGRGAAPGGAAGGGTPATSPATAPGPGSGASAAPAAAFPVTVKDGLGRDVTLAGEPRRIVSLAPSNTEVLFALGAGGRLVGVTDNCNYPPQVAGLEKLGGAFDAKHTNFERIVALTPDLVLGITGQPEVIERLESLGLKVVALEARNLEEVYQSILTTGRLAGCLNTAEGLVANLEMRVARVRARVAALPAESRPLVFYEVWPDPLMTAGPGSFIHDLIEIAGGRNLAADAAQPYPLFSLETLVSRDPQVILTTFPETVEALQARKRVGWGGLRAVKDGRVCLLDQDLVSRPGPRIVEGLEAVARAVHPELFGGE